MKELPGREINRTRSRRDTCGLWQMEGRLRECSAMSLEQGGTEGDRPADVSDSAIVAEGDVRKAARMPLVPVQPHGDELVFRVRIRKQPARRTRSRPNLVPRHPERQCVDSLGTIVHARGIAASRAPVLRNAP